MMGGQAALGWALFLCDWCDNHDQQGGPVSSWPADETAGSEGKPLLRRGGEGGRRVGAAAPFATMLPPRQKGGP